MSKVIVCIVLLGACALSSCSSSHETPNSARKFETTVLPMDRVEWTPLNPARGDASPKAATLWGHRGETVPTGFLVQFVDGFSSPPHIHNVSYRGVVIHGTVHNDDPASPDMYMSTGSYWTQPAGQVHITAARGSRNLAYIEIDEGPYLVLPVAEAFDNGEKPINVDATNIVWVDPSTPDFSTEARVAYLWSSTGSGALKGYLLKLPPQFAGTIVPRGAEFRAVVISGLVHHGDWEGSESLEPGSSFVASRASSHSVACPASTGCTLYVRTAGSFALQPPE